ncbi:MAG: TlpA family protein disulfide reductase [Micavibrio sp.]
METGNAHAPETAFSAQFSAFYPYTERRGMVPLNFAGADGEIQTLEDYKGKTVLLHFWATWCAPCVAELPKLQVLQQERAGAHFTILPIALDYNVPHTQVGAFMKKHSIDNLPVLLVPKDDPAWDTLTGFALPTSFLIGPDGRVLYKMVGDADWTAKDSRAFIDNLLTNQQK